LTKSLCMHIYICIYTHIYIYVYTYIYIYIYIDIYICIYTYISYICIHIHIYICICIYIYIYIYIYIDQCVNQYIDEIYLVYINIRMRSAQNIYIYTSISLLSTLKKGTRQKVWGFSLSIFQNIAILPYK